MKGRQNDEDELEVMATAEDPTPAKKKRSFTTAIKLQIIKLGKATTISNAAKQYSVDRQVISRWCKKEGELEESGGKRRRLPGGGRKPLSEELEDQLYE